MSRFDVNDDEASVLRALHAEGETDLYTLSQRAEVGPRAVHDAVQRLTRDGLVDAVDRGATLRCTSDGAQWVRDST